MAPKLDTIGALSIYWRKLSFVPNSGSFPTELTRHNWYWTGHTCPFRIHQSRLRTRDWHVYFATFVRGNKYSGFICVVVEPNLSKQGKCASRPKTSHKNKSQIIFLGCRIWFIYWVCFKNDLRSWTHQFMILKRFWPPSRRSVWDLTYRVEGILWCECGACKGCEGSPAAGTFLWHFEFFYGVP